MERLALTREAAALALGEDLTRLALAGVEEVAPWNLKKSEEWLVCTAPSSAPVMRLTCRLGRLMGGFLLFWMGFITSRRGQKSGAVVPGCSKPHRHRLDGGGVEQMTDTGSTRGGASARIKALGTEAGAPSLHDSKLDANAWQLEAACWRLRVRSLSHCAVVR